MCFAVVQLMSDTECEIKLNSRFSMVERIFFRFYSLFIFKGRFLGLLRLKKEEENCLPLNGCCSESKIELQHSEEVKVLWRLSIFRFFLCLVITDEQVIRTSQGVEATKILFKSSKIN